MAAGDSHGVDVDLPAGQYVAMCLLPSPDGVAHVDKGMLAFLAVTEPTATVPTIDTTSGIDVTITLYDYAFAIPAGFAGGRVAVANAADQPYELAISAIGPDGSYAQFTKLLAEGKDPTSLDPDSGDGRPHHMHGMVQEVVIENE